MFSRLFSSTQKLKSQNLRGYSTQTIRHLYYNAHAHANVKKNTASSSYLTTSMHPTTTAQQPHPQSPPTTTTTTPPPPPPLPIIPLPSHLILLFRTGQWHHTLTHLSHHPTDARWINRRGQTTLHRAVVRRPTVDVVATLLQTHPPAATTVDVDGNAPLHMAMSQGASEEVLRVLILAAPRVVLWGNRWGFVPMGWLWCRYEKRINRSTMSSSSSSLDDDNSNNNKNTELEKVWNMVTLLIWAGSRCSRSSTNNIIEQQQQQQQQQQQHHFDFDNYDARKDDLLLHATVSFNCPRGMLQAVLTKYPQQTKTKDEDEYNGRYPLAVAAASPSTTPSSLGDNNDNNNANSSSSSSSREIIDSLIRAYPTAATLRDNDGRLPLFLAIANGKGWEDGVATIATAAPHVVRERDVVSRLYAFMLAAAMGDWRCSFELLRLCPEILSYGGYL